ncbi:hypothetical protein VQ03_24490 [Methylobacterium tarhaniae]|uniref:Uncharacterized protein n=1 Tax=Methylobacterium tarhaniae TaxID=1187852 RepID=A0A0J6V4I2_9HYPH|nr:hypothetical protein [Methylobacterium tarhaniae]KMO33806.1 hypothetical protein VQ03_24490 [Methylobacterium tarhaniae]
MASPLPLVCRSTEPLRIAAVSRRRPVSRFPVAMLMRGLAVIAALGVPLAAATLADLAHPVPPASAR